MGSPIDSLVDRDSRLSTSTYTTEHPDPTRPGAAGDAREPASALQPTTPSHAAQIAEKLDSLRAQIAQFRAKAVDLHVKLKALESQGDPDARSIRSAMLANIFRIEGVVHELIDTPVPAEVPRADLAAIRKPPRDDDR